MKMIKKCPICSEGKKKRSCKLQQDELICISCCLSKQNYYCHGCYFYQDNNLKFKCERCGKTSVDDQPSDITKLMATEIFMLNNLKGDHFENDYAVSGEIYTTPLEFPFEGKINTPTWFFYDPVNEIHTLQLIRGEILEIKHFDEYKATAEIFVLQTSKCANIKHVFPEEIMPESLYDIDHLFPFEHLKISSHDVYFIVSSMIQDGGNRAVIDNDENDPRIILYAEGFFNHWMEYAGNIRIKKNFLQQVLHAGEC